MDPYLYLEDLGDPRTRKFIERHNRRLRSLLGDLPDRLYPEILRWQGVWQVYAYGPCKGRVYAVLRGSEGFRVVELPSGRVVLERSGIVVWGVYPSPDCSLVGVGYSEGSDWGVLEVLDATGGSVVDRVEGYLHGIAWRSDGRYYYVRMYRDAPPPDGGGTPSERVILRDPDTGREELAWGRGLPEGYLISMLPVYEEGYMLLTVSRGWSTARIYAGPIDEPSGWSLILDPGAYARGAGVVDGKVYAIVYDGPGTGRIVEAGGSVRELVAAHERYPVEEAAATSGGIVVDRLVDAKSVVEIYSHDGRLVEVIEPEEPSTLVFLKRWGDRVLGMVESFNSPMGLAVVDGLRNLYSEPVHLGLEVREEWVQSHDGVGVHYFVVGEGDWAIVYGYGGFRVSLTPWYLGHLKPLLDEGFYDVMANLRGGGEYGERWHEAGRRRNKHNVFEDYKAVARKVKSGGARIAGWGASNGGLLIAAVLVQEPGLLDAAVIGYPVIDMLRFHKLYIGSIWRDEYGDPENPDDREYLASYSPIHNAKPAKYPPTLVYTGLHDDRVHPGHALRFTAVLEELGAPVYLRVETRAGHMGADPKIRAGELADIESFLLRVSGKT